MSRNLTLVIIGLLGSLVAPASAYAQLTPARGIGRRGQFADQRRALRSRQSKRAQRPQRYRQRVEDPTAW